MRRRYDWAQLISDFRNSGLTQVEFAKRRGIRVGTFRQGYYAAKKRAARLAGGSVRFVRASALLSTHATDHQLQQLAWRRVQESWRCIGRR